MKILYDIIYGGGLVIKSCLTLVTSWLFCPWDSPGKNTGVSCHFLLQGIFLTRGLNLRLLRCRWFFTAELPGKHINKYNIIRKLGMIHWYSSSILLRFNQFYMDSFVCECVCVCVFSSVQFYHMHIHVTIIMVKMQNSSITGSHVLPTFIGIVTFLLSLAL